MVVVMLEGIMVVVIAVLEVDPRAKALFDQGV